MEALGPVTDRSGTVSDVNQGPIGPGHNLAINCLRPRPGPQIAQSQVGQVLPQTTTRAAMGPIAARSGTVSDLGQGYSGPDHSLSGTISDLEQGPGHRLALACLTTR